MGYFQQIGVIIGILFLMFYGIYAGIAMTLDGKNLDYELNHLISDSIDYGDGFKFDVQRAKRVKESGTYATEIYTTELLEEWGRRTITTTQNITFSVKAASKYISIKKSQYVVTVSPNGSVTPDKPIKFEYSVRGDVDLPNEVDIEYNLATQTRDDLSDHSTVFVFTETSFANQQRCRFIFFSVSVILWLIVFILIAVYLFAIHPVAGGIFVAVILVIGIFIFPPVKQAIETIGPLLKWLS